MAGCIFCKIVAGEIPSDKVFENDFVLAFRDLNPQAPVHILVVPKEHIPSAVEISAGNSAAVARCFEAIALIAAQEKLEKGFRVINNCGPDGGQSVMHLHFHVLGGKPLGEKIV